MSPFLFIGMTSESRSVPQEVVSVCPYFHPRSANVTLSSVGELLKRRKVKTCAGLFLVICCQQGRNLKFSAVTLRFHYEYCFATAANCAFLPNCVRTNQKTGGELGIYVFCKASQRESICFM